jgi:hypothetical protein
MYANGPKIIFCLAKYLPFVSQFLASLLCCLHSKFSLFGNYPCNQLKNFYILKTLFYQEATLVKKLYNVGHFHPTELNFAHKRC